MLGPVAPLSPCLIERRERSVSLSLQALFRGSFAMRANVQSVPLSFLVVFGIHRRRTEPFAIVSGVTHNGRPARHGLRNIGIKILVSVLQGLLPSTASERSLFLDGSNPPRCDLVLVEPREAGV